MKKAIKITAENAEKINEMIAKEEGKARSRTIIAADIFRTIDTIEKRLDIPKKYLVGIVARLDLNAQDFPKAYKYTPYSTHATIERRPAGWYLVYVWRDICKDKRIILELPEEAKQKIIAKYTSL